MTDKPSPVKTFFRVSHETTGQGLWYSANGVFTGLIHNELSFCKNTKLAMDFDPAIVGYVSVVETPDQLFEWFTQQDILKLQELGWFATEYQSDDYRWYERFAHYVANAATLTNIRTIPLEPESTKVLTCREIASMRSHLKKERGLPRIPPTWPEWDAYRIVATIEALQTEVGEKEVERLRLESEITFLRTEKPDAAAAYDHRKEAYERGRADGKYFSGQEIVRLKAENADLRTALSKTPAPTIHLGNGECVHIGFIAAEKAGQK